MKKIRVHISKGYLISILIFLAGLFLFIFGNIASSREKNALNLSELRQENCLKGTYVKGYIDSCIVKTVRNEIEEKRLGSSCSWMNLMGTTYEIYTIPMTDGTFIPFMAKNQSTIQALEGFINEQGTAKYVEGVIVTPYFSIDGAWYRKDCSFRGKKLVCNRLEELLSTPYAIQEINFQERKYNIYIGIILMVTSIGCFTLAGGLKEFFREIRQEFKDLFRRKN